MDRIRQGVTVNISKLQQWAGGGKAVLSIVFTDMVGSSKLNEQIGDMETSLVKRRHEERTRMLVSQLGGYFIKWTGDGSLVLFKEPSSALDFALKMRADTGDPRARIRIGIHNGEIEILGTDIQGRNVGIAARAMEHGKGAELWLTDSAYKNIPCQDGQMAFGLKWESDNEARFKGHSEDYLVWEYIAPDDPNANQIALKYAKLKRKFTKSIRYWELLFLLPFLGIVVFQLFRFFASSFLYISNGNTVRFTETGLALIWVFVGFFILLVTIPVSLSYYGWTRGYRDRKMRFPALFGAVLLGFLSWLFVLSLLQGEFAFASNFKLFTNENPLTLSGSTTFAILMMLVYVVVGNLLVAAHIWFWGKLGALYGRRIAGR